MSAQDCEQLTLFPGASPASPSALPGSEEARQMTVTSGLKCSALCRNSGPLGSLAKMLLASSQWSSPARYLEWRAETLVSSKTRYYTRQHGHDRKTCCSHNSLEALKELATPSRYLYFRLVPSAPPTEGTGCSLWPTVRSHEVGDYQYSGGDHKKPTPTLTGAVKMWPTPRVGGSKGSSPAGATHGDLAAVVAMFPTPIATDWKNRGCKEYRKNREYQLQTEVGGQLNPTWVEWLMGFPIGWTDLQS